MPDLSNYYDQIAEIDRKIAEYQVAKLELQRVKGNCEEDKAALQRNNSGISFEIPSADVFEGEMAAALSKKVSDYESDMNELAANGDGVIYAIDGLIGGIDGKIIDLNNQRTNVQNQLTNAINVINAANQQ